MGYRTKARRRSALINTPNPLEEADFTQEREKMQMLKTKPWLLHFLYLFINKIQKQPAAKKPTFAVLCHFSVIILSFIRCYDLTQVQSN